MTLRRSSQAVVRSKRPAEREQQAPAEHRRS
jgi:hypothetical protein